MDRNDVAATIVLCLGIICITACVLTAMLTGGCDLRKKNDVLPTAASALVPNQTPGTARTPQTLRATEDAA